MNEKSRHSLFRQNVSHWLSTNRRYPSLNLSKENRSALLRAAPGKKLPSFWTKILTASARDSGVGSRKNSPLSPPSLSSDPKSVATIPMTVYNAPPPAQGDDRYAGRLGFHRSDPEVLLGHEEEGPGPFQNLARGNCTSVIAILLPVISGT